MESKIQSWEALVFKKNVQAYLGFQKEFLSSNDEVALDTPPQSKRRGFAKNQWQHKTIIQKESLLKLSSTFWVSDIKASPTWEFDILHSLWKKNSNWQMAYVNEKYFLIFF